MTCSDLGPDLVALALGEATPEERSRVESHAATCAACAAELAATRDLFDAARSVDAPACAAGAEERLLAAVREERNATSGPVPHPVARPRRTGSVLKLLVPLAVAASIAVAVTLSGREERAHVLDGEGLLFADGELSGPGRALGRGLAEFRFEHGDEVAGGKERLSLRISAAAGTSAPRAGQPAAGAVEITLEPGARIVRRAPGEVELLAGTVAIAAGPLADPFTLSAPPNRAIVRGTSFTASTAERRLVVAVTEGSVEIGRVTDGATTVLEAGHEGLVDAERILTRSSDGRGAAQVFLTPVATLAPGGPRGAVQAVLAEGEGGAVSILAFDDSEPRFLLRLKGDDGREREVKIQRSMLTEAPPTADRGVFRLGGGRRYELAIDPAALGVRPGRYEASLRYMSYRPRSDGTEWLGVVSSAPVPIEVPAR